MDPQQIVRIVPFLAPVLVVVLWFATAVLLGAFSGWYRLMAAFPDRDEAPILRLRGQSGRVGGAVNLDHVLTLSVCPSGLRVGILPVFGPFCRDFLVPWQSITLARRPILFGTLVELRFGAPVIGRLGVREGTAARLAEAAGSRWPEEVAAPPRAPQGVVSRRR